MSHGRGPAAAEGPGRATSEPRTRARDAAAPRMLRRQASGSGEDRAITETPFGSGTTGRPGGSAGARMYRQPWLQLSHQEHRMPEHLALFQRVRQRQHIVEPDLLGNGGAGPGDHVAYVLDRGEVRGIREEVQEHETA